MRGCALAWLVAPRALARKRIFVNIVLKQVVACPKVILTARIASGSVSSPPTTDLRRGISKRTSGVIRTCSPASVRARPLAIH